MSYHSSQSYKQWINKAVRKQTTVNSNPLPLLSNSKRQQSLKSQSNSATT
ncbi:hypothetical protein Hanom_Chr17g01586041 [Helianthus anomalus]